MIKRLSDVIENIESIVKNPVQRGKVTGFKCFDALYSVKPGSFTIFLGSPAHGKSEIIFELLMNLSMNSGDINLIYSPETGSVEEIMIELAHKYLQKQIVRHHPLNEVSTELEMYTALEWVDHHFVIIDEEDGYSWEKIIATGEVFEIENKIKIQNIMAEPYNELVHDMKEFGGRQDLYIESFITDVRRYNKTKNKLRHTFLSFHTGTQQIQKIGDISYYPMPKAREAAGGQAAFRKAMTWINIWRPAHGLKNAHGYPYLPNEVLINIEKAKPKYISYRGTCSLYFDPNKNRYYEKINNIDCYAYDHVNRRDELVPDPVLVQSAIEFQPPTEREELSDLPF